MTEIKEPWTIGSILKWTGQYLGGKGVENPRLDAEVLLSHILGKDRLYLYVNFDQPLQLQELSLFRETVKQRALRVPVAYITGHKEFMGLDFMVDDNVLVPRPDTEILVETALERLKGLENPQIADIGTGSGAIIVSVLEKYAGAFGMAVDISPKSLAVAKNNAVHHAVADRLEFACGDLLEPLQGRVFDAILSNPPYIPAPDIASLEPEVRREPLLALNGGTDGLDFYRRLIYGGEQLLKPQGFMMLELGIGQAAVLPDLIKESAKLKIEKIVKDYAGIDRVAVLVKS